MSEQNLVDLAQQSFADFDSDYSDNGNDGGGDFEASEGQPGPGQGQSKSSRRRRRKRKNKVEGGGEQSAAPAGEGAPVTIVMEGESLSLAASAAPQQARAPRQQQPRPQGQNNGQPQGEGGKRWKKKFRDRDRRGGRSENPGNDFRGDIQASSNGGGNYGGGRPDNFGNMVNGGGGFKRKNKGGGGGQNGGGQSRGFVGPMDHSYREVGGLNDGPPSTVMLGRGRGRHHGDNQPIDHNAPRPVPIPENAQTHIYFFIEELFFIAKIQETARKQGIKVAFVKSEKEALDKLTSGEETDKPALIVFDLNNANAKPLTTIPKLKSKLKRGTSIVGFLSHLQGDLKAKAMEVGCDVVMPRAAFSQNLPNLLRRYGVEEEEEVNYNY